MTLPSLICKYFAEYHRNSQIISKACRSVLSVVIKEAHTDIKVPDFTNYRRREADNVCESPIDVDGARKLVPSLITATTCVMGLYGVKAEIHRYVKFMAPSADVLALARIEVKLSEVPEGKSATFKWRGKPLFIRHRTPQEIQIAEAVPLSSLRDPAKDDDRCRNKKFLIVIGVCTHLGCVPIADAGDYGPGGYYCPCHGSHFDAAGRIRKGPAPTNLEIPEHIFVDEETLVVG